MIKKVKNKIKKIDKLFQYYSRKKLGPVNDLEYPVIHSLYADDVNRYTAKHYIINYNRTIITRLCGYESLYEHVMLKARFDFEGYEGEKPIRACSFIEFYKIYGDICCDMIDKIELKGLNDYGSNAFIRWKKIFYGY